jgi:hypothetical protein
LSVTMPDSEAERIKEINKLLENFEKEINSFIEANDNSESFSSMMSYLAVEKFNWFLDAANMVRSKQGLSKETNFPGNFFSSYCILPAQTFGRPKAPFEKAASITSSSPGQNNQYTQWVNELNGIGHQVNQGLTDKDTNLKKLIIGIQQILSTARDSHANKKQKDQIRNVMAGLALIDRNMDVTTPGGLAKIKARNEAINNKLKEIIVLISALYPSNSRIHFFSSPLEREMKKIDQLIMNSDLTNDKTYPNKLVYQQIKTEVMKENKKSRTTSNVVEAKNQEQHRPTFKR